MLRRWLTFIVLWGGLLPHEQRSLSIGTDDEGHWIIVQWRLTSAILATVFVFLGHNHFLPLLCCISHRKYREFFLAELDIASFLNYLRVCSHLIARICIILALLKHRACIPCCEFFKWRLWVSFAFINLDLKGWGIHGRLSIQGCKWRRVLVRISLILLVIEGSTISTWDHLLQLGGMAGKWEWESEIVLEHRFDICYDLFTVNSKLYSVCLP